MIAALDATGEYRILRRVPSSPAPSSTAPPQADEAVAILLDLETTGLDPEWDEPIELAMVRFRYGVGDGRVRGVEATFASLAEPSIPIPPRVTRLTKLSADEVRGHVIDPQAVADFVGPARLVVAHNARFDRAFAESFWPIFERRPWACSCTGVDWQARGFDGARLSHLLLQTGFFHDAHRALDDAVATLHLLGTTMGGDGDTAFEELLRKAREPSVRIWAEGAPFASRTELRRRGYRWSDGSGGVPRAWFRDVPLGSGASEAAFLRREIYDAGKGGPRIAVVTAHERYSVRAGVVTPRNASSKAALDEINKHLAGEAA